MKKILYSTLILLLILNLIACGSNSNAETESTSAINNEAFAGTTITEADDYAKNNNVTGTLTLKDGTVLTYSAGVRVENTAKEDETSNAEENSTNSSETVSVESETETITNTTNEDETTNNESTTNNSGNANTSDKEIQSSTQAPVTNVTDVAAYIKKTYGATYYNTEDEAKAALYKTVENNAETIHIAWSGSDSLTKWLKSDPIYSNTDADYELRSLGYSGLTCTINGNKVYTIKIDFSSRNGTTAQQAEAKQVVKNIANTLRGKTRYEQIMGAYQWCKNNLVHEDDPACLVAARHKGQSLYSAVVDKVTVCTGYSKTFKAIMEELGIPCKIITGEQDTNDEFSANDWKVTDMGDGRQRVESMCQNPRETWVPDSTSRRVGHAWNLVELNGAWYHFDPQKGLLLGKDRVKYTALDNCGANIAALSYNKEDRPGYTKDDTSNETPSGGSSSTESSGQYDEEYIKSFLDARAKEENYTGQMSMEGIGLYYINGVRATEEEYWAHILQK